MKKISVIQIAAGVLLTASYFLFIRLVQPGYYRMEILDIGGAIIGSFVISPLRAVTPALVIWTAGYPLLCILVTGCGVSRLIKNYRGLATGRLDIAQVVFGALLLALMIMFVTSYEPHWPNYASIQVIQGIPGAVEVRHNPGWIAGMNVWKIGMFCLGPVIAAAGGWQVVKKRTAVP
jgi:hypothetical protein